MSTMTLGEIFLSIMPAGIINIAVAIEPGMKSIPVCVADIWLITRDAKTGTTKVSE